MSTHIDEIIDPVAPDDSSGKISVIIDDINASIQDLGPEEREQMFDKLSRANKLLPRDLFMTFRGRIDRPVPTIPEAILRVIINEAAAFQAAGSDHLTPHMNELVVPVLAYQTVITPPSAIVNDSGVIRVAFDIPTRAVAPDGTPRGISAGTNVAIAGVKINGCAEILTNGFISTADALSAGRIRGMLPTSNNQTIGLGAARRCADELTHPVINPRSDLLPDFRADNAESAIINGLPVKLPHQFNFADMPAVDIPTLLQGILEWVRWVGESSYRQAVLAYHDFASFAREHESSRPAEYPKAVIKCPDDLEVFNTLGYFETGCAFHQTSRLQLRQLGLERAYDALIMSGRSAAVPIIDVWKNMKMLEQWNRNASEAVRERNIAIKTYASVIEKKFGTARGKKFLADVGKMRGVDIKVVLQKTMKPSELSVVNGEYKRRQEYLAAVVNNKCPHISALRSLRRAISDNEIASAYTGLKMYFGKTKAEDYIECNKCGFGIMCPHKKVLLELDIKHAPTSAVKAAISPYIGNGPDSSFCKVCGETLAGLDALESYEAPRISYDDELAQFMWGEIAPIMRQFRFGPQIGVSQLITTVRDACYQYIFDIEKKLIRSKTSSAAEITAKKKLYIDIYAYAYMILLISKNPGGQIEFRGDIHRKQSAVRGGAQRKGASRATVRASAADKAAGSKATLIDLIKGITTTITVNRNVIIREIRGMTSETIRNALIDAYKVISTTAGSTTITTSDMTEDIASDILLGCVYESFYRASVFSELMVGKKAPKSEFDIIARLSDIMGGRLETMCKRSDEQTSELCSLFSKARIPRWNVKTPQLGSLWVGDKHTPLFKHAAGWYFARGFELFAERVTTMLYTQPIWKPVSLVRLDDYGPVKYTDAVRKYNDSIHEFRNIESSIERSRRLWSCQLYKSIGENKRRTIKHLGLDRLYGTDGHAHKWEKMIIGDKPVVDADFIAAVAASAPIQARNRTEIVCSVCGAEKSKTGKLTNDEAIIAALHRQIEIANFYRFYESRCPAGGSHDWSSAGVCTKCNLMQGKQPVEYYEKWSSAYNAEKAELNDIAFAAAPVRTSAEVIKTQSEWSFDYNMITKFVEVFDIRPRVVMALGIPEIIDWNAIVSGTWTPPVIDTRDHPRIFAIRGAIDGLIRGYNKLRMFKHIFKVPQSVITLIESVGVSRTTMNTLADTLPVMPKFDMEYRVIYETQPAAKIIEWLIETFCTACLWFAESSIGGDAGAIMLAYVKDYVSGLFKSEELTSKPGYFNWSLLYGDQHSGEESTKSAKLPVDDDDDASTPFSMDNYDMEDGDPDDDAMVNHAGDELGM